MVTVISGYLLMIMSCSSQGICTEQAISDDVFYSLQDCNNERDIRKEMRAYCVPVTIQSVNVKEIPHVIN